MAKPLSTTKATVNLAAKGPPGSRIRRDPPPKPKQLSIEDRDDRDRRLAFVGVIAFALGIVVAIVGLASYQGWSPSEVTFRM